MIEQHGIKVQRSAHFFTLGNDFESAEYVWFVFHGYGQLGSKIIHKFEEFDLDRHFIIAPEGLSKFYWTDPRMPVASWMTSYNRLDEIEDYLGYLDGVLQAFDRAQMDQKKIIFMPFSQGCATAWRWFNHTDLNLHSFVNWAGDYPPEIDYSGLISRLADTQVRLIHGTNDRFLQTSFLEKVKDFVNALPFEVSIHTFEGKHEIPRDVLASFVKEHIDNI